MCGWGQVSRISCSGKGLRVMGERKGLNVGKLMQAQAGDSACGHLEQESQGVGGSR